MRPVTSGIGILGKGRGPAEAEEPSLAPEDGHRGHRRRRGLLPPCRSRGDTNPTMPHGGLRLFH